MGKTQKVRGVPNLLRASLEGLSPSQQKRFTAILAEGAWLRAIRAQVKTELPEEGEEKCQEMTNYPQNSSQ
jgi:hypothetical protein